MRQDRFHQINSWYFLIYLVRNPAEALSSELKTMPGPIRWVTGAEEEALRGIVQNTRVYQKWQGPKLLLRYEELLADPAAAMQKLGSFLRIPRQRIDLCAAHSREIFEFAKHTLSDRKAVANWDASFYGDGGLRRGDSCKSDFQHDDNHPVARLWRARQQSLFFKRGRRIPLPPDVWSTLCRAAEGATDEHGAHFYGQSLCPQGEG